MPKTKAPYAAAFKQQIAELAMAGRTPAELARRAHRTHPSGACRFAPQLRHAARTRRTDRARRRRQPQRVARLLLEHAIAASAGAGPIPSRRDATRRNVWCDSAQPWVVLPDLMPKFPTSPPAAQVVTACPQCSQWSSRNMSDCRCR